MTQLNLEHLEKRLLEERDDALRNLQVAESEESVSVRESTGELSGTPSHMADLGSETQEVEKDFAIINRESGRLAAIDGALELLRNDPKAYAVCERCGAPIEPERLELIPWTRLCAADAQKEGEGEAR